MFSDSACIFSAYALIGWITPTRNCTHLLINVLNLFVCIELNFFFQFSFLYLIYFLGGIIGIQPDLGDHKSNFKKVGTIPSEPHLSSYPRNTTFRGQYWNKEKFKNPEKFIKSSRTFLAYSFSVFYLIPHSQK